LLEGGGAIGDGAEHARRPPADQFLRAVTGQALVFERIRHFQDVVAEDRIGAKNLLARRR
jgi:hypothetical protein